MFSVIEKTKDEGICSCIMMFLEELNFTVNQQPNGQLTTIWIGALEVFVPTLARAIWYLAPSKKSTVETLKMSLCSASSASLGTLIAHLIKNYEPLRAHANNILRRLVAQLGESTIADFKETIVPTMAAVVSVEGIAE